jgi:outer membrane protein assembly factor BamB
MIAKAHSRKSLSLLLLIGLTGAAVAEDWPQWRGPNRDGGSTETGLLKQWPEGGPKLVWKADGLGAGYSSVAVADGRIITLGDLDDGSYAIAIQESNAKPLWKTRIGGAGGHRKYPGTRSTPTIAGKQVFILNQFSDLVCLDAATGKKIWSRNLVDEFGGKMMSGWKYSESPLVDGDKVLCTPGGSDGTVLALNRNTGKKIWRTTDWTDTAGYSSIIIKTIHGKRQYIQLTGASVAGIDPDSGDILWRAARQGKTAVISTPVVEENIVFVTSGYGVGCNAFGIHKQGAQWTAKEIYANLNIANHHGGVVKRGNHVFGSSGATFRCLDIETGELAYNERSVGKGATVYADGHFYLRSEKGPVALIVATPKGLTEAGRFQQPNRSGKQTWPHPVVANGKLYLRDQDILLCYDIAAK